MAGKFRSHIRSNVVGYVALFFAVSLGTAWAATELDKNEVKSKHIGKGQVKNADLAKGSVTSLKVADGSLLDEDFAAGELPSGSQGPEGPRGPAGSPDTPEQVLDKIKQVDGSGSGLDADTVGGIPAGQIGGLGRSAHNPTCSDDEGDGDNCVGFTVSFTRPIRVLFIGSGYARAQDLNFPGVDDPSFVEGFCEPDIDGVPQVESVGFRLHHDEEKDPFGMTLVTPLLPPGSHTLTLRCRQDDGDIEFHNVSLSVVILGAD